MGNAAAKKDGKDGSSLSPTKESSSFDFKTGKIPIIQQQSLDDSMDMPSGRFRELMRDDGPDGRPRTATLLEQPYVDPNALPVVFRWEGGGKSVAVAGSFNNWNTKIPMIKSHGDFTAIVNLPEGQHEYKFFVDGQWIHNPRQMRTSPESEEPLQSNTFGTVNNFINVSKSDFEVFEALAIDSSREKGVDMSGSPPGDYNQEIPSQELQQRTTGPPILPPQLLQVILNKDIGPQYEPALLPEPNHVMLNHLYALSIKDGVMVLSATHRYRKKYVTSLLYKPIN
ncbi:5'-AMP-activated protein kinase subunit beta-2-like isoform X1 [Lytechinus variegatus]|uniref:5'-AMP-activated protein kinase subunit beta-2-like isoform X1 n=1 Tax=Lytechinus variegatus TaxID=7654 RepID=UPI001BB1C832|nr:5'-AMP-activated protein kinase subunit beta-2-like isoform X1 [Lytechinus variegatus]